MPLSEFYQMSPNGKLESSQPKMANCSSELSPFLPDQEFVELLWENGQIVMQGQSNRPRKSSFTNAFPSHYSRVQERDCRNAGIPKIRHFGEKDPVANELVAAVPSAGMGLNTQEDDMVPWINYPMEDSLPNDYSTEFLPEFSGINLSPLPVHNNVVPADRNITFGHTVRDSLNVEHRHAPKAQAGGPGISRTRTSQLFQSQQQCQSLILNAKMKASEFGIAGSSSIHQGSFVNLHDRSSQKQDVGTSEPPQTSTGMGLMNFSHFSRPAAIVRSNLQTFDRVRSNEKTSTATSSNPVESTVINSAGCLKSLSVQDQSTPIPPKVELRSSAKPPQDSISEEQSVAVCREDDSINKHSSNITSANTRPPDTVICQNSTAPTDTPLVRHEVEKGTEAVVASSSICSINSAGAESNDPKHTTKRKIREGEESGYQSEDLEEESVGIKKHSTGRSTNAKRSRAAEVHNLSERRRRDRINEKMRALQELIPNCNKVDKASMLDEAIEYLKTLQLQVQIMSMGTGLCMPPMMLPAGMQHIRPHPLAHFSPMGINMGMGMGYGYGMGMIDVNGSPGCPLIPVPPMHGPQFPCTSMPGAPSLNGMHVSTSLQMFGIPGHGHPASMPYAQTFSGLPVKVNPVPEISRATTSPLPIADAAPSANLKNQEQQNIKLEINIGANNSQIQTSAQVTSESFEHSSLMSNQAPHASGNLEMSSSHYQNN